MTTDVKTAPENAFTCELAVRWSDQDLNGHVNNARVITLVEEARVQADQAWAGLDSGWVGGRVVRRLDVEFDRALHYGHPVAARVWIGRIGRTSFTVCHELSQQGQRCVYAECVMVMIDDGAPTPVTDEQRAQLVAAQHPEA